MSIVFTEFGIVTLDNFSQYANVPKGTSFMELGNTILSSPDASKAKSPIDVTEFGIVI